MPPLITTSRQPSRRTRTLSKELSRRIPYSRHENRGKKSIKSLVEIARRHGLSRILIITEWKGNPGKITCIEVTEDDWRWHDTYILIAGVKLAREFRESYTKKNEALSIHDTIGVGDMFGLENEESNLMFLADENRITFMLNKKEIGPLIKIKKVARCTK